MPNYTKEQWNDIKTNLMEKCYECFSECGLNGTGIRGLGEYCGCTSNMLYTYFDNLDSLIVESTEHCMSKVEDDFMHIAPKDFADLERFLSEVPYWTAEKHGKKYRLMYQVYTHPKYREYGKKFFEGVNRRYSEYANEVAKRIGLPADKVRPMIFTFVRACVHFALYEDEYYLHDQIGLIKDSIGFYMMKYNPTVLTDILNE